MPSEKILFISDTHIGADISNFPLYESSLLERMAASKHVVLAGDIFELFYIPGADGAHPKDVIKNHLKESIGWLEDFLKDHPDTQVHFVLGNHENLRRFRKRLDGLQEKYPNFEWDPQAIKLGDALITHGDLQMDKQVDETRHIYRMRDAEKERRWTHVMRRIDEPGQLVVNEISSPANATEAVAKFLKKHDGDERFTYTENRIKGNVFTREGIKHVFFGHTHVPFTGVRHTDGITYHNLGSFTKAKLQFPDEMGALEAKLKDGKIQGVEKANIPYGMLDEQEQPRTRFAKMATATGGKKAAR